MSSGFTFLRDTIRHKLIAQALSLAVSTFHSANHKRRLTGHHEVRAKRRPTLREVGKCRCQRMGIGIRTTRTSDTKFKLPCDSLWPGQCNDAGQLAARKCERVGTAAQLRTTCWGVTALGRFPLRKGHIGSIAGELYNGRIAERRFWLSVRRILSLVEERRSTMPW